MQTEENDRISLILRSLGEKICHVIYFMEMDTLLKLQYQITFVKLIIKKKFKWQKRDIMMVDNILTAHSREAYKEGKKSYSCYCLDL